VTSGRGRTLITFACATLAALVGLLAPAAAQANPVCDPVVMDDVHSGGSQTAQLACDDTGGASLSYSVDPADDAKHGFVTVDGAGSVTYFSTSGYLGSDSWTIVVDNNEGGTTEVTVSIEVVNHAPVCTPLTVGTQRNQKVLVEAACTDPDGDEITLHVTDAENGTSAVETGFVSYDPGTDFVGTDHFTYFATDYLGAGAPATVDVTVNSPAGGGDPAGGDPGAGDPGSGTPDTGAPGGGDPGAGNPAGGTPLDLAPPTLGLALLPKQKLAKVLKNGLGVTVGCSEPCVANLKLTIAKQLAKKLGIASADVTLGSAKKTLTAGRTKIYVKLTAKARKRLKKARSVKLKLVLRATDAAGNAATSARTLTLKR